MALASGRAITCRSWAAATCAATESPGGLGPSGILPRVVKDTTAGPSVWPVSRAARARRRASRSAPTLAPPCRRARVTAAHGKDRRPITGRQRQRALKSPALQKLRAMTLDHAERAWMPSNSGRARQEAVEDQPLSGAELVDARLGELTLEVRAHAADGGLDLFEIARRLAHQLPVHWFDVSAPPPPGVLQDLAQRGTHALERGDRKGATALGRGVENAVFIAAPHGGRHEGTDDLRDAVVGDHAPALDPVEEGHFRWDLRGPNGIGLEFRPFHEVGVICGLGLVTLAAAAGHGARSDECLPPRHAASRVLRPITSPSRTGMIVATRRGSRAASSLKARTPSAGPERSFSSTAAP